METSKSKTRGEITDVPSMTTIGEISFYTHPHPPFAYGGKLYTWIISPHCLRIFINRKKYAWTRFVHISKEKIKRELSIRPLGIVGIFFGRWRSRWVDGLKHKALPMRRKQMGIT